MDLRDLTVDHARSLVDTKFEVTLADGRTTVMTLCEATAVEYKQQRRAQSDSTPRRTPFSLSFMGDPSIVVPQGTYPFRAPNVAFDALFIVPVARDEKATEYEAVFT